MTDSIREMDLLAQQINHAHHAAVQAGLNAAGLREIGHPMLLSILHSTCQRDGRGQCGAQRELAQILHISPAAVAVSLKSLEKGGYIRREPGRQDARRNQVLLTEKGNAAVAGCQQVFEGVSRRMLAGFSPEEQAQLMSFRRRMLDNLLGGKSEPQE